MLAFRDRCTPRLELAVAGKSGPNLAEQRPNNSFSLLRCFDIRVVVVVILFSIPDQITNLLLNVIMMVTPALLGQNGDSVRTGAFRADA